ncbi:MFS transporter [Rubrobacter marinus]|uniref:MFS transporter n=1 Tax=Rubrobacter marinus TaxID=2653852 RepID=A0A6G8PTP6_9ACTN|nr:MFS transporter [Rubrobacter marinus]QIN77336.1 MFS transporter [Rubrobacter marinus]
MDRAAQREPGVEVPDFPFRALLAVVAFAVFVIVMNGSMTNVALPTIGDEFGATEAEAGWVITGYLLVFAVGVPLYGRLSDVYSVRRIFCVGLAGFALGSLVCAFAPSLPVLVAGRMLQAAGGAAIPALSSTSVARLLPPGRRGGALGLIVSSVGVGGAVGPVVGGIVVQFAGWHALFYGTLLLGLLLIPAALRVLPETSPEGGASFDLPGGLLLALTAGLALFAVTEGQPLGLSSPVLWGSCAGALLSGAAFARRITRVPAPFVSPRLLTNRAYLACSAVGFFGMLANLTSIVFVPLLLLDVNGLGAGAAGLALAPGAVAVALLSPLAGRVSDRTGPGPPIVAGILALFLSLLVLSTFGAGGSYLVVTLGMLGVGVGFAGFTSPNTNATANTLPREEIGVGLGIYQMLFFLGGGAGPAIVGSYFAARSPDARALNPFYAGTPNAAPFSDAFLLLALCALLALVAAGSGLLSRRQPGDRG